MSVNGNLYFDNNDELIHLKLKFESLFKELDIKYDIKISNIKTDILTENTNNNGRFNEINNKLNTIVEYINLPWYKKIFKKLKYNV